MKKRRINYFKYFSLFFAIAVLVFIAGCRGEIPLINFFSANPSTITVGESSTLSWSVIDKFDTATSITIDPTIGSVDLTGTTTVTPATTTTYTLIATNYAGSVTASVIVTVGVATILQEIIIPDGTTGKDSYVSSAYPDNNYGNFINGFMGSSVNLPSVFGRGYFQYDLSTIPSIAVITSANFALYYESSGPADLPLGLYVVLGEWCGDTITWNNQPTCSTESEYTCTIYSGSTTGVYKYWHNLKDLVQGWFDGSIVNYGVMIRDEDESTLDTMAWFGFCENTEPYRPKLTVNYYVP